MSTAAWVALGVATYVVVVIPAAVLIGKALARAAQCCPHAEAGQ